MKMSKLVEKGIPATSSPRPYVSPEENETLPVSPEENETRPRPHGHMSLLNKNKDSVPHGLYGRGDEVGNPGFFF